MPVSAKIRGKKGFDPTRWPKAEEPPIAPQTWGQLQMDINCAMISARGPFVVDYLVPTMKGGPPSSFFVLLSSS